MHLKTSQVQMSESFWTISFLTFSGGLQDAYSYFGRGKVFANAMTGNIVLMASHILDGDTSGVLHYLVPIGFFALGIFCAQLFRLTSAQSRLHWRQSILIMEMILLCLVPLISYDLLANSIISFACAMQVQSFRKVHGYPFASTMCVGNTRSALDALATYVISRNPVHLKKAFAYLRIILIFILGAACGYGLTMALGRIAILGSPLCLMAALLLMFVQQGQQEELREERSRPSAEH